MIIDRLANCRVRIAVGLALLGAGSILTEPAPARAGRPASAAASGRTPGSAAEHEGPVPAYERPVPGSAKLHTVGLTVFDDLTGSPLAEVEVRIRNHVDARTYVFRTGMHGQLRFEYPALHDEPMGSVEVRKDGYVPVGYGWGFDGGPEAPESPTLRLRRGTTMGGVVVDEAGRPVEGATVLMSVTVDGVRVRADESTGYESYGEIPSRTGPDGRWRSESVPPGVREVELRLIHPDFVIDGYSSLRWPRRSPKVAALRDQSDRQVLLAGLRVEGRVVDEEGRPIAGARIIAATQGFASLGDDWCRPTDAEGRFHVQLSPGQKLFLTATARGRAWATQEVAAGPVRPAIEFRLSPAKRLRGRVIDPTGHPIDGARVHAMSIAPRSFISFDTWTDAEGRFKWEEAPDRAVPLYVTAEGYVEGGPFWHSAGENEAAITLRPAVDVRLQAVDA
jgi:protocatechuate 3,4-dioxygenase beta subunit